MCYILKAIKKVYIGLTKTDMWGWGYSSVAECFPGMCKGLRLTPSTAKKKKMQKLLNIIM
jgi:hypothetical protein